MPSAVIVALHTFVTVAQMQKCATPEPFVVADTVLPEWVCVGQNVIAQLPRSTTTFDPEMTVPKASFTVTSKHDAPLEDTVTFEGHVECAGSGTAAWAAPVIETASESISSEPRTC